ncbi:hypothetical protein Ancab_004915 [Ancistrocladus abbreviatus]
MELNSRLIGAFAMWNGYFGNVQAKLVHFPRAKLDHRPILLNFNVGFFKGCLFHFEVAWLTHAKFWDFVDHTWQWTYSFLRAFMEFCDKVNFPWYLHHVPASLCHIPNKEEICTSLASIGEFRARRVDGFPTIFFKSQWNVVGNSLVAPVRETFVGMAEIATVHQTLIVLIPKKDTPPNTLRML